MNQAGVQQAGSQTKQQGRRRSKSTITEKYQHLVYDVQGTSCRNPGLDNWFDNAGLRLQAALLFAYPIGMLILTSVAPPVVISGTGF